MTDTHLHIGDVSVQRLEEVYGPAFPADMFLPSWDPGIRDELGPDTANFQTQGYDFDRTESRARATWETLEKLRAVWPGKLVIKGVLDLRDAIRLKDHGVDAIQVSSHGARQLESAPAPFSLLPDMRKALGPDYPIFFDSGLRSGEDALKVFAAGADFAFFGRALQFAMAAGGEEGLNQLWEVLSDELSIAMAQTGLCDLQNTRDALSQGQHPLHAPCSPAQTT